MRHPVLWLAQGFGTGRIPFAPGTFGSIVGLGWFAFLLFFANGSVYFGGLILGVVLSIKICGVAEQWLGQKDPGSVVLDEIAAVPLCFLAWCCLEYHQNGWPSVEFFFRRHNWPLTLAIVAAFRVLDIAKPWPIRQSQSLPRGWGVTVDDLLAAVYVNLAVLLLYATQAYSGG